MANPSQPAWDGRAVNACTGDRVTFDASAEGSENTTVIRTTDTPAAFMVLLRKPDEMHDRGRANVRGKLF
jgi:hypothetical protein